MSEISSCVQSASRTELLPAPGAPVRISAPLIWFDCRAVPSGGGRRISQLVDLVHRRASESMHRDDQLREEPLWSGGLAAVGQQEPDLVRGDQALDRGLAQLSREQLPDGE